MVRGETEFSQLDVDDLLAKMPKISEPNAVFFQSAAFQRYLDFYQINFSKAHAELTIDHQFGSIAVGDFNVACHYWLPLGSTRSAVLVHGYYDHSGIYGHIIEHLLSAGVAVLCFDLPGHGLSSGERAAIDSFDHYAGVLLHIVQYFGSILPGPVAAIGQSTGCAAIMNLLASQNSRPFDQVALLAPLIAPHGWRSGQWFYHLLNKRVQTLPRKFAVNSHDKAFLKFLAEQDILQPKVLSVEWVGAMKQWLERFKELPVQFNSLLVIQGTDDTTVDWTYNLEQLECTFPKLEVVKIEGARHQLVNESEPYRLEVFAALDQYLQLTTVEPEQSDAG